MPNDEKSDAPAEIVRDDQLGGEPRLAGHRIGVSHIRTHYRQGKTIEAIADEVYPHLRVEQVAAALEYAAANPDTMEALERERERIVRQRERVARVKKRQVLEEEACPECGGRLVDTADLPLALVRCVDCENTHVVRLLTDGPER